MIKTGILGGETLAAGELIRILLNHPDVDLRQVASGPLSGMNVADVHRGLVGDTSLRFVSKLDTKWLDAVFLCGEPWMAREFMESLPERGEKDEALRIVDLTGAFRRGELEMVYGLPEHERKALVRGATRASIPSPIAHAVELALFPMAKNSLLFGPVNGNVVIAATEEFYRLPNVAPLTESHDNPLSTILSTRLDPVAPAEHRPDSEAAALEAAGEMKRIQPSFNSEVRLTVSKDANHPRGILAVVETECNLSLSELERIFKEAYEDHNFTYVIDRIPEISDVANTNKCLLHISYAGNHSTLKINVAIDNLLKGAAGNAVHCFNLLFGLSERTGLELKPSGF